ncbi:ComF family protein [Lactococcus fujiensis]|uniref:ComF family protein n=1 Tax=Lactococcus fujiensis TaxID=610251 RepID=UPI0006CFC5C0|nr:ComF family protein [Lactococcus fujiensis]
MNCYLCNCELTIHFHFTDLLLLNSKREMICSKCQATFERIDINHCPRCYQSGFLTVCPDCLIWEEQKIIVQHRAIFKYNQAMKDYFKRYKFQGDYNLFNVFKQEFHQKRSDEVMVPIPVSTNRMQERGFNQVTAFLQDEPYLDLLIKKNTPKQSSLTRSERLNTENPFELNPDKKIPKKVLVIDDIYTTGATLQHAVHILLKNGAEQVRTFSLCR